MLALILAAAVAAATPTTAPAAGKPSVIAMPDWLERPRAADMARYYPKAAADAHVEGRATIACKVTDAGLLADCVVASEAPAGQGFGEAALSLAQLFRMRAMTRDGQPVSGGKINIPINFRLPQVQPLTLETALECYGAISVAHLKLTNGEDADIGWREAVQALGAREHMSSAEVDAQLAAARELAQTPGVQDQARAQVMRCRAVRNSGALAALQAAPSGATPATPH